METIKKYAGLIGAAILGLIYAIFRRQQTRLEQAESSLAKATFKLNTQENDKAYEDAKNDANRLVTEYQSARSTDNVN
jgi:hypothetical protein